jgi:tetratricopeptide (TPR) repeat protein
MGSIKRTLMLLALGPIAFYSCTSVSTVSLDVMRPAEVTIPPEILSAVVVDNSYPYSGDSLHLFVSGADTLIVDSIRVDDFGNRLVQAATKSLHNRMFFDNVYMYPEPLYKVLNGKAGQSLSREQINELLDSFNAQVVISLEQVSYQTITSTLQFENFLYLTVDAQGSALWKVYNRDGGMLDVFLQRDSIYWDNEGRPLSKEDPKMPSLRSTVYSLADFMGDYYPDRIVPYWEKKNRYYFSSGHYLDGRADDLVKANNWESAARVWYYVFEEGNKKQKAMSAFNIALSYEIRGDYEEAAAWAKKSVDIVKDRGHFLAASGTMDETIIFEYYDDLVKRAKEAKKLEEQVGLGY